MAQGQLWYGTQGTGDDARIVRVDNDGTNQTTVVDNNPASFPTSNPSDIGLDTARGYYFAIFNNGFLAQGASLVRGSLTGGATTTVIDYAATGTTGPSGQNTTANSIVSALVVDPFSQRIFVGVQDPNGADGTKSGIRSYSYDANGNITDNGFLITQASSGKGDEVSAKLLDVNDFAFDRVSGNLYFTETGSSGSGYTGLFRVNVNTPGTAVQVVSQTQFPDSGANGFIRDVEVDAVRGHVFFSTYSRSPIDGNNYDANDNGIWVISTSGGAGQTATRVALSGLPANFYPDDMTFDTTTNQLYIETEGTNASNTDDVILVYQLSADGLTGNLIRTITPAAPSQTFNIAGMTFNDLPDVAVSAAATYTEDTARVTVLSSATVADGDSQLRGATVQLTTNFNSATDSLAFTNQGGITGSYNTVTGLLNLSGVASASTYQTAIRSITFAASGNNPTNFGAATSRGYSVTVDDGSPAVPAGSSNFTTGNIAITAVNDAPAIANLNGDNISAIANNSNYLLDAGNNATVSDADSANFDGGTLTVTVTDAQSGDTTSAGQGGGITRTNATVSYDNGQGAQQIATYTGFGTSSQTYTFNANATPEAVQALLRVLTFSSTSSVGGTRNISYALNDGDGTDNGGVATSTVASTVTLTVPNQPPVAVADTASATEDVLLAATTRAAGLLGNDTDPDAGQAATLVVSGARAGTGGTNTAVAASGTTAIVGTYGTLNLAADGTYSYTANNAAAQALAAGAQASEVFTYTARDTAGAESSTTLTITITGANDGPTAVADTASATEDVLLAATTRAAGLLGNDTDPDAGQAATLVVSGARAGTGGTNTAVAASGTTAIVGTYGTLNLAADGTYSYTANNAAAQALAAGAQASEVFTYTARDTAGAESSTTLTITITGANDGPTAVADTASATEDVLLAATTRAAGLLGNDTDPDAGQAATLVVSGARAGTGGTNTAVAASGTTAIVGTYGTLNLAADGTYSYTANNAAAQALAAGAQASEVFTYTARDTAGAESSTTLTITITGANDGPTAVADTASATEDVLLAATTRAAGLLGNDTDPDAGQAATLVVSGARAGTGGTNTAVAASGTTAIVGTYGTLNLAADGTYSYTANNAAAQALAAGAQASEVFTYTARDTAGAESSTTLTITITGANDGPTAVADTASATEDVLLAATTRAAGLLGNDTDPDAGQAATLVVSGARAGTGGTNTAVAASGTTAIVGTYGTLNLAADGTYSYTANNAAAQALAAGAQASEVFTYTARDTAGAESSTTLTITITGANDGPTAVADTASATEDVLLAATTRAAGLLGNDTDPDAGQAATLVVSGARAGTGGTNTAVAASGTTAIVGTYGTLNLAADGTYSYTANNAAAQALAAGAQASEVFTYTARDTAGAESSTTLTITITGANDGPTAVADTASATEDVLLAATTRAAGLLGNDTDPDAGQAATLVVSGARAGTGGTNTAVAASGTTAIVGTYGTLNLAADGTYSYTANNAAAQALAAGAQASEVFTYTARDTAGAESSTTLTITITGANDGPTAVADTASATEDVLLAATTRAAGLLGNDTDPDAGQAATLVVSGARAGTGGTNTAVAASGTTAIVGTYGTLNLAADGTYSYTANNAAAQALAAGAQASEVFTYTARDTAGAESSTTLTIAVTGVNDAPVLTGGVLATYTDTAGRDDFIVAEGRIDDDPSTASNGVGSLIDADRNDTYRYALTGPGVQTIADGTLVANQYGQLIVSSDGRYQFAPNSDAINALPAGSNATQSYTIEITDGAGAVSSNIFTVQLTGATDAVVLTGGVLATFNDTGANDTFGVQVGRIDNDPTVTSSGAGQLRGDPGSTYAYALTGPGVSNTVVNGQVVGTEIVGTYGRLVLANDGRYQYVPNNAAINAVPAGSNPTDSFTVRVNDSNGSSSSSTFTVQVNGATENQVALTGGTLGAYTDTDESGEDFALTTGKFDTDPSGVNNSTSSNTGTTVGSLDGGSGNVSYALTGPGVSTTVIDGQVVGTQVTGTYGTFNVASDGRYQFEPNDAAIDTLPEGQQTLSYTVQVTDTNGTSTTAIYTISLTGETDPVVLSTGSGGENGVLASYTDTAANDDFQVVQGRIDSDPSGASNGVGQLTGDVGARSYFLTSNDDGESQQVQNIVVNNVIVGTMITTEYGSLNVATDGRYQFVPNDLAINALGAGQNPSQLFSITVIDTATQNQSTATFRVDFTGAADTTPVLVGGSVATFDDRGNNEFAVVQGQFDTDTSGGNNSINNDTENSVGSLEGGTGPVRYALTGAGVSNTVINGQVVGTQVTGTYGTFNVASDGRFQFVPNETAINAVPEGSNPVVNYTVQVTDANGATTSATYSINVIGGEDAPIINENPTTPYFVTLTETNAALTTSGKVEATDPTGAVTYTHDRSGEDSFFQLYDTHLSYGSGIELTAAQLASLESAFTINAQTGAYSFNLASPDFLDPGQTLYAEYAVRVTNQAGETSTQIIEVDIRGTAEQGPVGTSGDDTLTLASGAFGSIINGGSGDDIITGGAGNDILRGQSGDDILQGGLGFNAIDGGSGIDVGVLEGDTGDYSVSRNGSTLTFYNEATFDQETGNYREAHQFVNVESFQFADGTIIEASDIFNGETSPFSSAAANHDMPAIQSLIG